MPYFVIAGGFAGVQGELTGRRADYGEGDRLVDYIIKIEGLPVEFFNPESVHIHKKYYCQQCKRYASEGEIEAKLGCYTHPLKIEEEIENKWNKSIFEEYKIATQRWVAPAFRIWVNNEQGKEKFRLIWKYIESNFPAHKTIPLPVPVGNKMQWLVTSDDVPRIDLKQAVKEIQLSDALIENPDMFKADRETTSTGMYPCHVCGKEFPTFRQVSTHIRAAHQRQSMVKDAPKQEPETVAAVEETK